MYIKGSVILRKKIVEIFKEHNLSYSEVAKYLNTDYSSLIMWLNANEGGHDTKINEKTIIKLCGLLGIEIRLQLVIHPFPKETLEIAQNKKITNMVKRVEKKKKEKIEEFFKE